MSRWSAGTAPAPPWTPNSRPRPASPTSSATPYLPGMLSEAARRTKRLACLHPSPPTPPTSRRTWRSSTRSPSASPGWPSRTGRNCSRPCGPSSRRPNWPSWSVRSWRRPPASTPASRPSGRASDEKDVADLLLATYRAHGCDPAYTSSSGAGLNGTVLHYSDNDAVIATGDLIVMDCAAAYRGYASDVTRTLPASGTFSEDQREIYEIVLESQLAAIAAASREPPTPSRRGRPRGHREGRLRRGLHPRHRPRRGHRGPRRHAGRASQARHGDHHRARHLSARPRLRRAHRGRHPHHRDGNRDLTSAVPKTVEAVEVAMRRG